MTFAIPAAAAAAGALLPGFGSVAAAATTLGTVGAGIGAFGTYEQGAYSSQVAKNNAKIAAMNAAYASGAGQQKAATESMKGAAQIGDIKAAQAANGVDVNSGSALNVQSGARELNKYNAETVLNDAELQAWGFRTQQQADEEQAKQDQEGGELGAFGSLLSKAGGLGLKWPDGSNSNYVSFGTPIAGTGGIGGA